MKLNNKGFAITAVLYGLLILFVSIVGYYLTMLGTKKNRLDQTITEVEKESAFDYQLGVDNRELSYPYRAEYTGKYVFDDDCYVYLYKYKVYNREDIRCEGKLEKIFMQR